MVRAEMELEIYVQHWRHEDGVPHGDIEWSTRTDPIPAGWYCWCFPNDNYEFEVWMRANCPTADITKRFNSGNPMFQTYISSEKEAAIFTLRWL